MKRRQAGFTVLELVIGLAIMSLVMGAAMLTQRSTGGLLTNTATSGLLEEKASGALEMMASELKWADTSSMLITSENGSDRIDFSIPTDFVSDATVWSSIITYRVEASNFDADEDGVQDEGQIFRVQDGEQKKICDYVAPGGLLITLNDKEIQLQLTLSKRDGTSDGLLTTIVRTSVSVRN